MNERGGDANGRGAVAEKTSEPPPSKVEALDGSNYEEWSGRMRSAFKRYKLLKIAVGEEKMPEEGEAGERWIEKSAVLFDLILQSVNKEMFEHIKDLDVHGHEGDVGSVGKVVMHPLTHWMIDSGCTSHMTPRADLLDEVKPPGKIKYVAAASAATAAAAKATAGGDATAPTDGVLEAVKKVHQQQTHGEKLTVSRDVKFLESLYYKEWKQQQQKLPSTPLIVEADELQQPSRQVEVAVSEEEMSGVTEEGGAAEVEQQQQHDAEQMLEMQFKCSKMGEVKYYLGMHVERDVEKGVLRLHQRKYCEGLAEKYGLQDGGKPATPLPSGFTVEPCADEEVVGDSDRKLFHSMLEAAKRLVRYVSATASVGLEYSGVRQRLQRGAADVKSGEMLLSCYTDASFNSVKADGTSIGGYEVRLEIVKTHQQAADIFTKRLAEADHWKGMKLAGMSVH
ncbi:hypothetical protein CLOP_g21584 [Closterium sp. NIES-67]|nr:hypothetical protein CLOP_g21584 [Closterium sp. NIES-67]